MYLMLASAALFAGAYSVSVIWDAAHRQPINKYHDQFYTDRRDSYVIVLIGAALVCGFALDKVLP